MGLRGDRRAGLRAGHHPSARAAKALGSWHCPRGVPQGAQSSRLHCELGVYATPRAPGPRAIKAGRLNSETHTGCGHRLPCLLVMPDEVLGLSWTPGGMSPIPQGS